jgi:hypothetical protein
VENIGNKLTYFKFQNLLNPFGILFHPIAIESLITNAINEKEYVKEDLFFLNEQWHSYDAHSRLSHESKDELLNTLNCGIESTHQSLNNSTHVIITLGTSWVYRHVATDAIVANCHKVPQKQFAKELLSVNEITESLLAIMSMIRSVNTKASVIFTVSPVRHIKDGFIENSQSKAHLISAILNTVDPRNEVYYFPSYEIMMDELRDYRFYDEDLLHPNKMAVNYIWEKFQEVWISSEAYRTMQEVDDIQKGLLHRPFNANSESFQKFQQNLELKMKALQSQFPQILF